MQKRFYITTTLPYVNAEPHIGFAMELVRADIVARGKKLQGFDVFFNTGTDEHGQKLFTSAKSAGKDVKDYVDEFASSFKKLPEALNISSDIHFVRTTDPHHERAAQEFWKRCFDNGYIYKKTYQVKYCVGCELEKTDSELEDGKCPLHPKLDIELIDEENYFFKFSAFTEKLKEYYEKNPNFVIPDFRFNEIKAFVDRGLEDFSISRLKEKMSWGIPVPNDDTQVMYVWFDALVNYISTLSWPEDKESFDNFWANEETLTVQYCGKDNLRQQSAMWQAMLMAAGLPNTKQIVINGFITGDGGVKMSKSLGNTVNPFDIINEYGADALRYFLVAELSSFEDSPFTIERFKSAYNAKLANGIGNLVSRVMKMAVSYEVKEPFNWEGENQQYLSLHKSVNNKIATYNLMQAMDEIMNFATSVDLMIQDRQPFKLIKTDPESAKEVVSIAISHLKEISNLLKPFLPDTAQKIEKLVLENKSPETPLFLRKD